MKKLDNSIIITLIVALTVLILGILFVSNFGNYSQKNTLTVQGQSSVDITPDLVKVYLTAQSKAATSQEAKDKNSEISDKIFEALKSTGFPEDEIKTQDYNIYPDYSYSSSGNKITGYTASQTFVITFSSSQSDKISNAVDAGIDSGASLGSINFELSPEKQNEYKAKALQLASEDARGKAESIASGLGKTLGTLVSASDNTFNYSPWIAYSSSDSASTTEIKSQVAQITPSDRTISATVQAVFKIR